MPHEELEYTLKMNKRAILSRLERVQNAMKELQTAIESDNFHCDAARTWTDGHASEEMTAMASLMAQQRALTDALHIVKKNS